MPRFDPARVIAAYHQGVEFKRKKEELTLAKQRDLEDRKYELDTRKAQTKLMELQFKKMERDMESGPLQDRRKEAMETAEFQLKNPPETPEVDSPLAMQQAPINAGEGMQDVLIRNRRIAMPVPPVDVPSAVGGAPMRVPIQSAGQIREREIAQRRPVPYTAAAGSQFGTFDPVTGARTVQGTVPKETAQPTQKSLQSKEVAFKTPIGGASHGMVLFDPDPESTGYFIKSADGQLVDITQNVAGDYRPPQQANTGAADNRMDRSYQFNVGQLNAIQKPVEESIRRMGRLQDTVFQSTPQADALIAPELLTVMAGGQGSGLRMNEAEIARIIGGRSKWESIKAAVNKWQLNPAKALSVTTDQRRQINDLIKVVNDKLLMKQDILDDFNQQLVDADSVDQHRQIVADARKALSAIDSGTAKPAGAPAGGVKFDGFTFPNQAAADAYKKEMGK